MRHITPLTALILASTATATPVQMTYTGRVLDGLGQPAEGPTAVTVSLYTGEDDVTPAWTQNYTPNVDGGFFTVVLDRNVGNQPLDSSLFSGSVWVGLTVGGADEMDPRTPLFTVPSAAHAEHAATADSATTASNATTADLALAADHATTADSATHATTADSATTATSAATATTATTATTLKSQNWGRLIVDTYASNFNMPSEWTTAYLTDHVGETWIWSADGPNLRDHEECGAMIQVYDQETAWRGQYIATVDSPTRVHFQWSGWYLRVNNAAGALVAQGNGMVTAELSFENGGWRVQHMSGNVGTHIFHCA